MKKIFAAAAVAVAIASPAMAQSYDPSVGSGNIARNPYRNDLTNPHQGRAPGWTTPYDAYAQSPVSGNGNGSPYAGGVIRRGGVGSPHPNYWYERNREEFTGRW
jgi:opacity protein-like surface antigen